MLGNFGVFTRARKTPVLPQRDLSGPEGQAIRRRDDRLADSSRSTEPTGRGRPNARAGTAVEAAIGHLRGSKTRRPSIGRLVSAFQRAGYRPGRDASAVVLLAV